MGPMGTFFFGLGLGHWPGSRAVAEGLEFASERDREIHMGSCQNYGPFLGTLKNRCHMGPRKGTIILTTTHITAIGSHGDYVLLLSG